MAYYNSNPRWSIMGWIITCITTFLTAAALIACSARPTVTPTVIPLDAVSAAQTEAAKLATQAAAEATKASARLTLTVAAGGDGKPAETFTPTPAATFTPTPTATPTATPPPPELSATTDTANVRVGPGTNYARLGEMRAGENFRITGKNAAGTWWQITFGEQVGWVSGELVTVRGDTMRVPPVTPPPPPAVRCFVPRLRFYVEHKGCCGELVGEVRDRYGQPFSAAQLEVTVPDTSYRTEWPLAPGGDYNITALDSRNIYKVRLIGALISSGSFEARYPYQRERAVLDFFETVCGQ